MRILPLNRRIGSTNAPAPAFHECFRTVETPRAKEPAGKPTRALRSPRAEPAARTAGAAKRARPAPQPLLPLPPPSLLLLRLKADSRRPKAVLSLAHVFSGQGHSRPEEMNMKGRLMNAQRARGAALGWAGVAGVALALSGSVAHAQLAAPIASGEITSQSLAPELRAELDSYISSALLAFDVPGAAVAVLEGGRVAYRGAFGVRSDGDSRAVDTRTLFMVGSITKSMTSTMIATLVDDGIVGWDDPVERLLPTFGLVRPEYEARVTLRHLLSHQSGLSRSDVSLFLGSNPPLGLLE